MAVTGWVLETGELVFDSVITESGELVFNGITENGNLVVTSSGFYIVAPAGKVKTIGHCTVLFPLNIYPPAGRVRLIGQGTYYYTVAGITINVVPGVVRLRGSASFSILAPILANKKIWNFTEQEDKFGYQNNPLWDENTNPFWNSQPHTVRQHIPCGHWHRRPIGGESKGGNGNGDNGAELLPYIFWGSCPQFITMVGDEVWFATTDDAGTNDTFYILGYNLTTHLYRMIYTFNSGYGYNWGEPYGDMLTVGDTTVVALVGQTGTGLVGIQVFVFTYGVFSRVVTIPGTDNNYQFQVGCLTVSGNTIGIAAYYYQTPYAIYYLKSIDLGVTWTKYTVASFGSTPHIAKVNLYQIGTDLYIHATHQSTYVLTDKIYKSTDGGDTWSLFQSPNMYTNPTFDYYGNVLNYVGSLFTITPIDMTTGVRLRKSTDNGATFSTLYTFADLSAHTLVSFYLSVCDGKLIAIINSDTATNNLYTWVYISTDNGVSWTNTLNSSILGLAGIGTGPVSVFVDGLTIAFTTYYGSNNSTQAGGYVQSFWVSFDGGYTWNIRETNFYSHLNHTPVPTIVFQEGAVINGLIRCAGNIWPFKKDKTWNTDVQ